MARIEAELVERLLERIDLRARHLHFRLADLPEVARRDVAGEQADDHDHHQQLEQREAFYLLHIPSLSGWGRPLRAGPSLLVSACR